MRRRYRRSYYKRNYNYNTNSELGDGYVFLFLCALPLLFIIPFIYDNFLNIILILFAVVGLVLLFFLIIFILKKINKSYDNFVLEHSLAIQELKSINITFHNVPNVEYDYNYDNVIFFDTISPQDYLIYQLTYDKAKIIEAINNASKNDKLYIEYKNKVNAIELDRWDNNSKKLSDKKLKIREKILFRESVLTPKTSFSISVNLNLTNINGRFITSKQHLYTSEEISSIMKRLKYENGFYVDNEVWQSICRVERGKVTNKLRFFVYDRDGNKCVKCGSPYNLEVDHIFPISKGGKSTPDNLQTLCHHCNSLKSNDIERGAVDPRVKRIHENAICPLCGAPTIIKTGKYGKFLACSSFPKCKYTKKI